MRKILMFLVLGMTAFAACAQAPIHKISFAPNFELDSVHTIAILQFEKAHFHKNIIVDKFTAALVNSNHFTIVDRADIKKIFNEVSFQQSGVIDEKTRRGLRQLGADCIMTGTLHAFDEKKRADGFILSAEVHLMAKMVRIETGEVLWSAEILKRSRAKNIGRQGFLKSESEATSANELLDQMITEMAESLLKTEGLFDRLKVF